MRYLDDKEKNKLEMDDRYKEQNDSKNEGVINLECRCNDHIKRIISNNHQIYCYLRAVTNRLRQIPYTQKRGMLLRVIREAVRWFIKCDYGMLLFSKMIWENLELEYESDEIAGIENDNHIKRDAVNMKDQAKKDLCSGKGNTNDVKNFKSGNDDKNVDYLRKIERQKINREQLVKKENKIEGFDKQLPFLPSFRQRTSNEKRSSPQYDMVNQNSNHVNSSLSKSEIRAKKEHKEKDYGGCATLRSIEEFQKNLSINIEKLEKNIDIGGIKELDATFSRSLRVEDNTSMGVIYEPTMNPYSAQFHLHSMKNGCLQDITESEQTTNQVNHLGDRLKVYREKNTVKRPSHNHKNILPYQNTKVLISQPVNLSVDQEFKNSKKIEEESDDELNSNDHSPKNMVIAKDSVELLTYFHPQRVAADPKQKNTLKSKSKGYLMGLFNRSKQIFKDTINHTVPYYLNIIQNELFYQESYNSQDNPITGLKRIIYEPAFSKSDNFLINEKIKLYRRIKLRHLEIVNMDNRDQMVESRDHLCQNDVVSTDITRMRVKSKRIPKNETPSRKLPNIPGNSTSDRRYPGPIGHLDLVSQFTPHFQRMKNSLSPFSKLLFFYRLIDDLIKYKHINNIENILPIVIYLIIKFEYLHILKDFEFIKMDIEMRQNIKLVKCLNISDETDERIKRGNDLSCLHIEHHIRQTTSLQNKKSQRPNQAVEKHPQPETTQINLGNKTENQHQKIDNMVQKSQIDRNIRPKGNLKKDAKEGNENLQMKSIENAKKINKKQEKKINIALGPLHTNICWCYTSLSNGQATYLLVLLESAIFFIKTMEYDKLAIKKDEYDELFLI